MEDSSPHEPLLDVDLGGTLGTPTLEQTEEMLVDALCLAGVRKGATRKYAMAITKHDRENQTFIDVCGRGHIVTAANGPHKYLNVKGPDALNIETVKGSGEHWDFSRKRDRDEARRMVAELQPTWVVGSPPCTALSSWQHVNYADMSPENVERNKMEGIVHLKFVAQLAKDQVKAH